MVDVVGFQKKKSFLFVPSSLRCRKAWESSGLLLWDKRKPSSS